jgi:predicted GNAT family acetyltransferase
MAPMTVLQRIDNYLHEVPRSAAKTEEIGPFTLFIGDPRGWAYYARPRPGSTDPIDHQDVEKVVARQRELEVPLVIEAVVDTKPGLPQACARANMQVQRLPLLAHREQVPVPTPDGIRIRRLSADDDAVSAWHAVAQLGFSAPGTDIGADGAAERDALVSRRTDDADDFVRARMAAGYTVAVVAEDAHGVVATGAHSPVGGVTEVIGIATLPAFRRRGIAAAITNALVANALDQRVDLVLLSAGSEDVARVYERVGFRRVGSTLAASAPD